jgi:hypothetical protein
MVTAGKSKREFNPDTQGQYGVNEKTLKIPLLPNISTAWNFVRSQIISVLVAKLLINSLF